MPLFSVASASRRTLEDEFSHQIQALAIPGHFPHVGLDMFVVMPNHIHGILFMVDKPVGAKNFSPLQSKPRGTFKTPGSVIHGLKIGVTKRLRQNTKFYNIWQRNYYDRIIRNDKKLNRIRQYIAINPIKWKVDRENPDIRSDTRTVCEPLPQYGNEPWQI
jgi:REP element-mobilizing transposase RayT